MVRKYAPNILLLALILITTFLFGVKYGQKVEKFDKYLQFILSLTPTPKQEQTNNKTYKFKILQWKECGLKFVYPESFEIKKNSRTLELTFQKKSLTKISCFDKKPTNEIKGKKIELVFKNKKIEGVEKNSLLIFDFYSPTTKLYYRFYVEKSLYPLISGSVEFTKE